MKKAIIFVLKKIMKDLLSKLAKHSYMKHSFLKEWRVFILIVLVVKLAAMLFSIFAGYFYFNNLFISLLNSPFWAKVFAGINLLLIEVLTAIAISKFFKFVIRGTFRTAIPVLFIVIALFSISFISSTNGLALRQSTKVDNIESIENQYNYKAEVVKAEYHDHINIIKARIKDEQSNPQGWTGGKRTSLLKDQLLRIDSYYADLKSRSNELKTQLSSLENEYQMEKQANNGKMQNESDKFYDIVAIVMILIFLVNGLLMFFYSRIFDEREAQLSKIEIITEIGEEMQAKTDSLIENAINTRFSLYFEAFDTQAKRPIITEPNIKEITPQIGFISTGAKDIRQNDNRRSPSSDRQCKHCETSFDFKHWNKQFCSDECRIAFWEAKNPGKKIYRKKY